MLIALDYDGTYTSDPKLWAEFVALAVDNGHEVVCITMRHPHEPAFIANCSILYTCGKAKRQAAIDAGLHISIWIDDQPEFIANGSL